MLGPICVFKSAWNCKSNAMISLSRNSNKNLAIVCPALPVNLTTKWRISRINASKCFRISKSEKKVILIFNSWREKSKKRLILCALKMKDSPSIFLRIILLKISQWSKRKWKWTNTKIFSNISNRSITSICIWLKTALIYPKRRSFILISWRKLQPKGQKYSSSN